MNYEVISPYCGLNMEGDTVNVYYLQTEDLAREYVFESEKDAQDFYNSAKNLDAFMVNVPEGKEELYHQAFLEQTLKDKDYELILHKAIPKDDEQEAS